MSTSDNGAPMDSHNWFVVYCTNPNCEAIKRDGKGNTILVTKEEYILANDGKRFPECYNCKCKKVGEKYG